MLRIREILDAPNSDGVWTCYFSYDEAVAELDGEDWTIVDGVPHKDGEPWVCVGGYWEKKTGEA